MVTTTRYIYDGNQYLAEADETDTINRLYTNEPDAYTHLISQEEVSSGDTLTYHYDALGSTRSVTDETETVTDEFTYDAWGNRLSRTGTSDIPFQYVGEHGYYREDATESYYVMARTYQPSTGRWWSQDPLGFIDGLNLYVYVMNGPEGEIDASGMAVRDYNPKSPLKMPYCEVGTKTQNNKDGLPIDVYGRTDPLHYEIICVCQCCNQSKNLYELKCLVRAYLRIRIAPEHYKSKNDWLDGYVYGHEQLHVKNLLEGAEVWAKQADKQEKAQGCGEFKKCEHKALELNFVGNNALKNWVSREREHNHPSKKPKEGQQYLPIGGDEVNPNANIGPMNCKSPGDPQKNDPQAKHCDECG